MYSKKNHINANIKNLHNDFIDNDEQTTNIFSSRNNIKKGNQKITDIEENKNIDYSINNDYFKEYYYNKKNKKNIVSYYSKKKFKSFYLNNDKPQISNYIVHPEPFYSELKNIKSFEKKQKSITYTIKNPQKEKSKNKNNKNIENNNSTLNKEEYEEDLNNLNSNNSNSIYTDFVNNIEINKKTENNRSLIDSRRGNIDLSRYQEKNLSSKKSQKNRDKPDYLQQSSSNMCISCIMDLSKDDERNNLDTESPIKMNKKILNYSIIRNIKSPFDSSRGYESILVKKNKNKTPNIRKQIEYRKRKFEKMREIEKKIKNYFIENGINLKNRELYHQSAIMIQSSFRAYISRKSLYKELNKFVGIRLIFDFLNKLLSEKNINYYKNFFNNIKKYSNRNYNNIFLMSNEDYQYHIKNKSTILKKTYILKKKYIIPKNDLLKIESSNTFNIINEKNSNDNKNLILLNEQLLHEKDLLEEEIKKLKIENEKLQKDNETYKSKESQFSQLSNNSLTVNKIIQNNIHKNDENIENVSIELREMKKKKKKIDALNIPILNLKKNSTILDKFWKNQSDFKKYKFLCLKFIILKKDITLKEDIRKVFYKYLNNIKNKKQNKNENKENKEKDELNKIYKFNNIIENIIVKFRNNMCALFLAKFYKFLFLKEVARKAKLFIPKYKIQITKVNNNDDSLKKKYSELIIKEKKQILKRLIKNKIKKQTFLLYKKFIKFYYLGVLNNNINNSNSFTNIINTSAHKIYSSRDNIFNHNNKIKDIEITLINKKEINSGQNQNKRNENINNIYIKKLYETKNFNKNKE